jgi:Formyl transferase
MVPLDLPGEPLELPPGPRDSIVIVTGGRSLRHEHFALLIQQRFPGMVKGWYAAAPRVTAPLGFKSFVASARAVVREHRVRATLRMYGPAAVRRAAESARDRLVGPVWPRRATRYWFDYPASEAHIFSASVARLHASASVRPTLIDSPNEASFREVLESHGAYFLLSLGGPLISAETLGVVRGLPINTHVGWAPHLRGSLTTEQAIYHRRLDWIGNTVHVTTPAADAGPILARTPAAVFADDTPADCFHRVVAAGNHLMCRVVTRLIRERGQTITVYPQTGHGGVTYRMRDFTAMRQRRVARDLRDGWLGAALRERRSY